MGELKDRTDLKLELKSSMPDFVSTSVPHLSYSQALWSINQHAQMLLVKRKVYLPRHGSSMLTASSIDYGVMLI